MVSLKMRMMLPQDPDIILLPYSLPYRRTLDEGSGNQADRQPIATTGPGQDA